MASKQYSTKKQEIVSLYLKNKILCIESEGHKRALQMSTNPRLDLKLLSDWLTNLSPRPLMVFISLAFQLSQLTCCCGNQFFGLRCSGRPLRLRLRHRHCCDRDSQREGDTSGMRRQHQMPNGEKKKKTGPLRIGWDLFLNDIVPCSDSLVKWKHKSFCLVVRNKTHRAILRVRKNCRAFQENMTEKKSYNTWYLKYWDLDKMNRGAG